MSRSVSKDVGAYLFTANHLIESRLRGTGKQLADCVSIRLR